MSIPAFYSGTGRRKTAIARVRLLPGEGEIVVNGRTLEEHFGNAVNESEVRMPFRVTGTEGRFNVMIKVEGGGVTGQAGAIRHGIARALLELDPEANRLPLRQAGLLTRDPRMKETQEVRAQASPEGSSVHEALVDGADQGRPCVRCRLRSVAHAPWGALAPSLAGAFAWTPQPAHRMTTSAIGLAMTAAAGRWSGATCCASPICRLMRSGGCSRPRRC